MKKLMLMSGLLACLWMSAGAADGTAAVQCDGFRFALEPPALVEQSTALVPLRAFCGQLEQQTWIEWDAGTRTAAVMGWEKAAAFTVGQGDEATAPRLIGGTLYVPARVLAQTFGLSCGWDAPSKTVLLDFPRTTVRVTNAKELLNAVAPFTTVELAPGRYDLSALRAGDVDNPFARIETIDIFYEPQYEVVICNAPGLTLRGEDCEIVTAYPYADVLKFECCDRLTVSGFTAGHHAEKGSCLGDVLEFDECAYVLAEACDLYGCGTYGVTTRNTAHLTVRDTVIRECSYGAAALGRYGEAETSGDIRFQNCRITGNVQFALFEIGNITGPVWVEDCEIADNRCNSLASNRSETCVLTFRNCIMSGNVFETEPESRRPGGVVVQ